MNKNILFYTISHPMFGLGGAEIQTYYYAKAFSKLGWKVYFLTPRKKRKIIDFDNDGITVLYCIKSGNIFKYLVFLYNTFKKNNISIIFFRNTNYKLGLFVFIGKILNIDIIWSTMHDNACNKKGATYIDRNRYKGDIYKYISFFIKDIIFQWGVKHSKVIITQNHFQQKQIKKEFNRDSLIIYSSRFPPEISYLQKRENIVLFIATIKEFKRVELFCEIAERLKNKGYRFIIIGQTYNDKRKAEHLEQLIRKSNIKYIGPQPLDKVEGYLSKAKLLVNTSIAEGFPNTFLQAWAYGVPVVSLKIDPDNLIEKKNLGYVCNDNVSEAISKIDELMSNKELWERISYNTRNFFMEKLNLNTQARQLSELFLRND